jgi:PHD/YefM family antitoxin component YafN of YafNO toxin-antitoxin module
MRKTVSMAQLARHMERIANDIEAKGTVYRIKRPGHPTMLLMDDQYFDGWMAVIDIMRMPNWREQWDESNRQIAEGRGRELETIVRELGLDRPTVRNGRGTARRTSVRRNAKGLGRSPRAGRRSA